jgi:hypothetical protein
MTGTKKKKKKKFSSPSVSKVGFPISREPEGRLKKQTCICNCWQDTERMLPMNLLTDQEVCPERCWEEEARKGR